MPHEARNWAIPLPFEDLGKEGLENFVTMFLAAGPELAVAVRARGKFGVAKWKARSVRHRIASVNPAPGSGKKQDGIDIIAMTDRGSKWVFQVKHWSRFSDSKATAAMDKADREYEDADRYFFVVSCEPSGEADKAAEIRGNWEI